MSHALATVLHRGRKAASIVIAACLANRRRQRSELRPHPKEEAMSYALATVLHRGRRPRVASREARWETAHVHRRCLASRHECCPQTAGGSGVSSGLIRRRRP